MEISKNSTYLKEITRLNWLLRSVCIITVIPSDEKTSATTSNQQIIIQLLEWMYTVSFYALSCYVYYCLIYTKSLLQPHIMDNLTTDSINYVLITLLSISIVLLNPLLACRAHENREKYVQLWRDYQTQYEQYTVSELNLSSTNFIVSLTISGAIVTAFELIANCVLMSQTTPVYMYAHWLIYFYTNFTTVLWVADCHLLTKASRKLLDRFLIQTTMSVVDLEPRVFRYGQLWRKLADMADRLMNTGRGMYELNFVIQSVIVVQSFYGIVAFYIGQQQFINYNIYFPIAVWSIINLVSLCEAAYSVTTQMGFKTKVAIQSLACNSFNLETQEQIFIVLKTIQSNTPEVTVGGYFKMNRTYIISYLGIAISYIIVLVQFKIGTSK